MSRSRNRPGPGLSLLLGSALVLAAAPGSAQLVWDRSDVVLGFDHQVSGSTRHMPFTTTSRVFGLTATLWIDDGASGDNGTLDFFSGSLGWGVYEDAGGAPGAVIADGVDASPTLWDTGFQSVGGDQIRVQIELEGLPALPPGSYWLGVRETALDAPSDGTLVYLAQRSGTLGDFAYTVLGGRTTHDQSDPDAAGGSSDISSYLTANDFALTATTRLSSLAVWLMDDAINDNGVLDSFDGTLSWALLADAPGPSPGSLLDSGSDFSPLVFPADFQHGGRDVARVEIELRDPITLTAGYYWLALHEGAWGSVFDADEVWWLDASTLRDVGLFLDSTETGPGPWSPIEEFDSAFVLFQSLLFASGFEAEVTCAWTVTSGGATCP